MTLASFRIRAWKGGFPVITCREGVRSKAWAWERAKAYRQYDATKSIYIRGESGSLVCAHQFRSCIASGSAIARGRQACSESQDLIDA